MMTEVVKLDNPLRAIATSAVETSDKSAEVDRTGALTRLLARGDEAAFREFHLVYFDRLYQFLLVVTRGNEHAAQEALQETLVRVARYVRVFENDQVFWSWLKCLARSAARDAGRKQHRYAAMLDRFTRLWRPAPVERDIGKDLLQEKLADALDALEPVERHLIEQKYISGVSTKELAAETGLTEKAVDSRLLRLRRQLREKLLKGLNSP
jgi:RNA polymerase sigma-70 factor, ECF subfamily